MMSHSKELFRQTIAHGVGAGDLRPLGGVRVEPIASSHTATAIAALFQRITNTKDWGALPLLSDPLMSECEAAKKVFCDYYDGRPALAVQCMNELQQARTDEERAAVITRIWLPELRMSDEDILARWRVRAVQTTEPPRPEQVTIQLNGLYTVPDTVPADLDPDVQKAWLNLDGDPGGRIADYDHPVPLFVDDGDHELLNALDELESDLAYEKEQGVIPAAHRMLVTLSLSVTHERLDELCGHWIKGVLRKKAYRNVQVMVLTETALTRIKRELFAKDYPVYGVVGKYAMHFNALKYTQLLQEKAYGIKAGFKLDTDEGIRSRDAHALTGKTWLRLMCHPCWGAEAVDWKGRPVTLDINEGEYVNSSDLERLGYAEAVRCPDVKVPSSAMQPEIFFNKAFAHGRATALYNQFDRLEDFISHTVVKGGGYGITNSGLRKAAPFTFSQVGRAEDQQFYFSGLARGVRGIFHPDLRIAHYKSSVQTAEHRTRASRFIGDLYRLIIFQELVRCLGVKEDIDPMPGVFAGELARCQAFFCLLYRAYAFAVEGDQESCDTLMGAGRTELNQLQREIDSGTVQRKLNEEYDLWQSFIGEVDALDNPARVRELLDELII